MRGTSDFDVRTVTIEGLTSVRYLLPMPVGIVTVIATMRSTGLSWSHDTCCVDGEIGSLSNESISELLPAESEGIAPLFCTSAELFGRRDAHAVPAPYPSRPPQSAASSRPHRRREWRPACVRRAVSWPPSATAIIAETRVE